MSRLYNLQNTKQVTDTSSLERLYTEVNIMYHSCSFPRNTLRKYQGIRRIHRDNNAPQAPRRIDSHLEPIEEKECHLSQGHVIIRSRRIGRSG
jgi:hypothetical protein